MYDVMTVIVAIFLNKGYCPNHFEKLPGFNCGSVQLSK